MNRAWVPSAVGASTDLAELAPLQPQGWRPLASVFERYRTDEHCQALQIRGGDGILAVGATISRWRVTWLAHIVVHPEHRRRGLGTAMVKALLATPQAQTANTVSLLATDMAAGLYRSLGFETVDQYLLYDDVRLPQTVASAPELTRYCRGDGAAILRLDREVACEDRSSDLSPTMEDAFVHRSRSGIDGFYLPKLGEGLVVARSEEAGIALMRKRLETESHAGFPAANQAAASMLRAYGKRPSRSVTRMERGALCRVALGCIFNRIGGDVG